MDSSATPPAAAARGATARAARAAALRVAESPAQLYRPPAPWPVGPQRALLRALLSGERDLITLLPGAAYRSLTAPLGVSRRGIFLVSDPADIRDVLVGRSTLFPKNDLMVGALEPLVGHGVFVADGADWERQRRMIDPAFGHMHIHRAFGKMAEAVSGGEAMLDAASAAGHPVPLEQTMSRITADIVFRTIFSQDLAGETAHRVFDAFAHFQKTVANVELRRLLWSRPFARIPQPRPALAAAGEIRALLADMIATHRAAGRSGDIAADLIAARDPETGTGFTDTELVDQIGVFFLAGHETTASVLTWCFFILGEQPEAVARMRAEIEAVTGGGPVEFAHVKRLGFVRSVFREALRLYPPITFYARVAREASRIGPCAVPRGAMILVSPWVIHRHERLWRDADRFDPDRFSAEREGEIPAGAYLPFGMGPRICSGAAFATVESILILARLTRRYDIRALEPGTVRPVARLTTRPACEIACRVARLA